jgi:mannose-6-phosphate isomerase-like protein (cupin superfamily)
MENVPHDSADYPYETHLNVLFPHLVVIDIPELVSTVKHPWWNQTLCEVNESVVRLGVIQGEYHWHKHETLDEFFYVVEGRLFIDMEDRMIDLRPQQCFVVPRGARHKPRAPEKTVILMVEGRDIIPTGD